MVGGVTESPVIWRGASGIGETLEKFGGVGLNAADAPCLVGFGTGSENCVVEVAGTKVGASPWIPSV